MGWTEERTELLRKLWAEGLSASQIAGRLGGVTRNAVIGKVHRLGLAGRTTTSRSPRRRNRVSHLPIRPTHMQYRTHRTKPMFMPIEQPAVALALMPSIVEELNIPAALRIDLLDLKECMCRWPVGDPKGDNFHFCGRQKSHGVSYCEHHARVAFQPVSRRKR